MASTISCEPNIYTSEPYTDANPDTFTVDPGSNTFTDVNDSKTKYKYYLRTNIYSNGYIKPNVVYPDTDDAINIPTNDATSIPSIALNSRANALNFRANALNSRANDPDLQTNDLDLQTNDPDLQTNDPVPRTNDPDPRTNDPDPRTNDPDPRTNDPDHQTNDPDHPSRSIKNLINSTNSTNPVPVPVPDTVSLLVKKQNKDCKVCLQLTAVHELIAKLDLIIKNANKDENICEILKTTAIQCYDVHVIDTVNGLETMCTVYKLISHIANGGEANGIHFALLLMPENKYKYCVIKALPVVYGEHEKKILRSFKYNEIHNDPLMTKHYISYTVSNFIHIVNEFIDGHCLEHIIMHHPEQLTAKNKRNVTLNIYQAIRNLHKKGYLHLDIKPQNVMLTQKQSIKIIDFGKSVKLELPDIENNVPCNKQRVEMIIDKIFSTPIYTSPNVVMDKEYEKISTEKEIYYFGIMCDLWSFGMTIYELYMGHAYYNKENSHRIGKLINLINNDMKNGPELNIEKLVKDKNNIRIDDDIIEVLKLCLVHRTFTDHTVNDAVNIIGTIDCMISIH
jgi:hypothetical protein